MPDYNDMVQFYGWDPDEDKPPFDECDKCGDIAYLIDCGFRSTKTGKEIEFWTCSRCYHEEYDEAMSQIGDY